MAEVLEEIDRDADGLLNDEDPCPNKADCDRDGIIDGVEVLSDFNPLSARSPGKGSPEDRDGDGLRNSLEVELGTNADSIDTDNDGASDGLEIVLGSNALKPDSDSDGFRDGFEMSHGSNPLVVDRGTPRTPNS